MMSGLIDVLFHTTVVLRESRVGYTTLVKHIKYQRPRVSVILSGCIMYHPIIVVGEKARGHCGSIFAIAYENFKFFAKVWYKFENF